MSKPDSILQEVDDAARALARRMIGTARHGALAVLEAGSGHPVASRVSVAPDIDGTPVILVSSLAPHTAALDADARCSLLLGEPARGDPLAHPRISVLGSARRIARGTADDDRVRARFLARHPKAALYAGFADFAFFRIELSRASLNGGFGRAWSLTRDDLIASRDPAHLSDLAAAERDAVSQMNTAHADSIALCATGPGKGRTGDWRIVSIDPLGFEMMAGERVERLEFEAPLTDAAALRPALLTLADRLRRDL